MFLLIFFSPMNGNHKFKTLVVGASENPSRMSHRAVQELVANGFPVLATGVRPGYIGTIPISESLPKDQDIDTITLYIRPEIQGEMLEELLELKPRRIIFNPGTENPVLEKLARARGISTENACTLVLLSLDQYND